MTKRIQANARCQVCRHEHRWRIELLRAGGASLEALAQKFGVDKDSIWRHWHRHVTDEAKATYLAGPVSLEQLIEKAATEGDSVLDYLKICRGALLAQLAGMQVAGDSRNVAYVTDKLVRTLEVIARVSGTVLVSTDLAPRTELIGGPHISAKIRFSLPVCYPSPYSSIITLMRKFE